MRIVSKFLGLLTIFSLTFAIPFHATAAEDKESFFPASLQQSDPQRVFSLGDDTELGFSQLGNWPDKLCSSTADPNCDFNDAKWGVKTIEATALLNVYIGPSLIGNNNPIKLEAVQIDPIILSDIKDCG